MRVTVALLLIALAVSQNIASETSICFAKSKMFYEKSKQAVQHKSIESSIDSIEKLVQ